MPGFPTMKTLTDIVNELNILAEIEPETDAEQQTLDELVSETLAQLDEKVDAYIFIIKKLEADSKFFNEQAENFLKKSVNLKLRADYLKDRLKSYLESRATTKVTGNFYTASVCQNGGKQPIWIDRQHVPEEFTEVQMTKVVDTDAIRKHLEESGTEQGVTLDGVIWAELQPRGKHLRLK